MPEYAPIENAAVIETLTGDLVSMEDLTNAVKDSAATVGTPGGAAHTVTVAIRKLRPRAHTGLN